ncbi:S-adenosyl-L-methionine-dependent methyltransferase [Microdochium bolleyi]|uniref:S-adenosyl-L-methionine-dependent methyltransferase n=1 Tax=Microdochium bolleyi TaxID=196109 RepID=A0A136ITF4_9PEZI|nr:S-adenosyl-L-methionine-dependent methyltransferase [Microdochium bolleyi]
MANQNEALQAQYATVRGVLDDAAVKMIASGEAIMKTPGRALLAQMGLVPSPEDSEHTTSAPIDEPFALLDNACGPGLIAGVLQEDLPRELLSRSRILCADINGNFVDILKQRAEAEHWVGVEAAVLDAQNPGLPDNSFSHCTVNFGMHVIPDPDAVLRATKAFLKPGGVFGLTTMHSSTIGWSADLRSAFSALPFPTEPLPEPLSMTANGRAEWAETAGAEQALRAHGFEDVRVRVAEHRSPCLSGADAVERFGMMIRMVAGTHWSEESRRKAFEEGFDLMGHVARHLDEKHGGKAWELEWRMLIATARKPAA